MSNPHPTHALTRRRFVLSGLAAAVALCRPGRVLGAPRSANRGLLLSACDFRDGSHHAAWLAADNNKPRHLATDFRGHDAIEYPHHPGRGIFFARRPGATGCVFDIREGRVLRLFHAGTNRHFYGHGCFSADGRYLFTAENDYRNGTGIIGIRDAETLRHLGEWPSHGIGPHDVKLLPDSRTLAIANGGILTHPDSGRMKLNLDTMAPNLAYMDVESGHRLAVFTPPERQASIRHLAVTGDGRVVAAMQFEREAAGHGRPVPLLALQRGFGELTPVAGPEQALRNLNDYIGSVAIDPAHGVVGVTSPRGNTASFWDFDSRRLLAEFRISRVCGLALTADGRFFALSNALGEIRFIGTPELTEDKSLRIRDRNILWDNHLAVFTA